jgi:hypothetical protein
MNIKDSIKFGQAITRYHMTSKFKDYSKEELIKLLKFFAISDVILSIVVFLFIIQVF